MLALPQCKDMKHIMESGAIQLTAARLLMCPGTVCCWPCLLSAYQV
jgi:hypothetical protein